ncbi:hypothetical protein RhiirC2_790666 [Rhizophagus irregularis]|uniref:Uncharacterized protein n=1 Tax=Rhizophagus irregularis TaxID=588596 RepID=A0A2N1MKU6_9GLOM|nr:hypothetical protein RhiirC2_790666 [Rhizophagus irregularis]
MNANTFLTNISKSLHTLEDQNNSLSITSDKNELKLQEIHKSIINLTTLIQQQSNSINGHFELIEENVDQLKLNQNNMLNNINEILSNIMTVSEEALLASSTRLDIELNNTCDQSLFKQVDRNANDQRDQELVKPPKPAPKTTKKRKSNLKPVFRNTRSRAAK